MEDEAIFTSCTTEGFLSSTNEQTPENIIEPHMDNSSTSTSSNRSEWSEISDGESCCEDDCDPRPSFATPRHISKLCAGGFFSQSAPNLRSASSTSTQPSGGPRRHSVHVTPSPGHIIFPRRKAGDGIFFSAPKPIVVTLDTLETLKDLPLGSAAEKLGISPTAFKRACRVLGIRRWTYQKLSDTVRAKALRRMTNAARRLASATDAAPCTDADPEKERSAGAGDADSALCWIVAPPVPSQPNAGGAEQEIELSGEEEVLTGPEVFEWPRYLMATTESESVRSAP